MNPETRSATDQKQTGATRKFASGATRDTDQGKLDYEGFLAPAVLKAFAEYMHKNRLQSDGQIRASDNWQKGIPIDEYRKSLIRHLVDLWLIDRGHPELAREDIDGALGGILFNAQGYWLELIKSKGTRHV